MDNETSFYNAVNNGIVVIDSLENGTFPISNTMAKDLNGMGIEMQSHESNLFELEGSMALFQEELQDFRALNQ